MARTYRFHHKNGEDLKFIYEQEGIDYNKELPAILTQSRAKRLEIEKYFTKNSESKIPFITHQVYFSFPDNWKKIDQLSLSKSLITTKRLNSVHNFKHYIWTNNDKIIPEELSSLPGVEVHLVNELREFRLFNLVESILNRKEIKLTDLITASDITRVMVMREFGGTYHDFDYEVYNPQDLIPMFKAFNFIAGEESAWKNRFIGHAFFASTPHHPILNKESELLERNLAKNNSLVKPDYIKYPYSIFDKLMFTIGPAVISIAFFKEQNKDGNIDILLPHYFLFHYVYLWQNTPESLCHKQNFTQIASLINIYDEEIVQTIGADSFCSLWNQDANSHQAIIY
jgi:hypothetical protein